jgi:hypothetical protein
MEMDQFLERLPAHLQSATHSNPSALPRCFELQAHVLKARYKRPWYRAYIRLTLPRVMYMRLRLLRPILLQQVSKDSSIRPRQADTAQTATMQVEKSLRKHICQLCITAAHEVLEELHQALSGRQRTLPWHALFCTAPISLSATIHRRLGFPMPPEILLMDFS